MILNHEKGHCNIYYFHSCRLPPPILFVYNNSGCFINHEKTMCRMYKMIVVIMNYISCNTFLFIKFRMYILRYIDFVVIKLIVTKWPYVNCIVWIVWLIFFYMTFTIGLCVLDFLGSSNVFFLVHFECIYQQMKLLGCIQVTNRCRTNSCKFKHPHIKLWIFRMHSNGQ
jgi:hypothetical protein